MVDTAARSAMALVRVEAFIVLATEDDRKRVENEDRRMIAVTCLDVLSLFI